MLLDVRPDHLQIVQAILQKHVPDREVWAFGSRAKWVAKEYSDLDLCIVSEKPISFTTLGLLTEAFEESDLPYKVDVVDWAITSESFRKIIEKDKVVVQKPQKKLEVLVMSSEKTLADIAEIVMGQSPSGDTCNSKGEGIPLLNGPTEFGQKYPHPVQFTTDAKKVSLPNDLLFCVRGSTTGRMNWADKPYAIGRGLAAIRGKDGYPNTFVRSVIEVNLEALLIQATGSTFPNVSRDLISSLPVPNLSQESAKVVASIVEPIDDRIAVLRETNQTLEAIAQALFKSWFVDFDPVRAKAEGRLPEGIDATTAALFPDTFEESELGLVPKGWTIKTLGDITERITKGTTPTTLKRPFVTSGINFVKAESMTGDGGFIPNKFAFIDEETHQLLNRSQLKAGDILISIAGTIGRIAVMTDEFLPANTNQAVAILRPISKIFPSELINRYLRLEATQRAMNEKVVQAVQANLSLGTLSSLKLSIPPEGDIEKLFNSGFAQIEKSWTANEQRVMTLTDLRDTLLPRLISGQLRIADAEAELEKATA